MRYYCEIWRDRYAVDDAFAEGTLPGAEYNKVSHILARLRQESRQHCSDLIGILVRDRVNGSRKLLMYDATDNRVEIIHKGHPRMVSSTVSDDIRPGCFQSFVVAARESLGQYIDGEWMPHTGPAMSAASRQLWDKYLTEFRTSIGALNRRLRHRNQSARTLMDAMAKKMERRGVKVKTRGPEDQDDILVARIAYSASARSLAQAIMPALPWGYLQETAPQSHPGGSRCK